MMNPVLMAGTTIVNLALISYSIFFFKERKTRKAGSKELTFLTAGVLFDLTATTCMIIGSSNTPFTVHGIIGYSSLAGMLTDSILFWRFRIINNRSAQVPAGLHRYSFIAYGWWITAYLTGAALVILK